MVLSWQESISLSLSPSPSLSLPLQKDLGKYLSLTLDDYTIQFQGVYESHPHTVVEFYAVDTRTDTFMNVSDAWRKLTENGQDYRVLRYHIVHVDMKGKPLKKPCVFEIPKLVRQKLFFYSSKKRALRLWSNGTLECGKNPYGQGTSQYRMPFPHTGNLNPLPGRACINKHFFPSLSKDTPEMK